MRFTERVEQIIGTIPSGTVASYGQVAALAGSPGAARQVGFILRSASLDSLPWWRVINNAGVLSIKGSFEATKQLQKDLLLSEGVAVSDSFTVDIEHFRFRPSPSLLRKFYALQT
jgi:methylated-DNA-protein-cysteine methyltransferase-like protein